MKVNTPPPPLAVLAPATLLFIVTLAFSIIAASAAVARLKPTHPGARVHKVRGPTGKEKDVNAVLLAEKGAPS